VKRLLALAPVIGLIALPVALTDPAKPHTDQERPDRFESTEDVLRRGLGMIRETLRDPLTLQRYEPSLAIGDGYLHAQFGVAADYAAWRDYRAGYEASVDERYRFRRLKLKQRMAEDPLSVPSILERLARRVEGAETPLELMVTALEAADIPRPEMPMQAAQRPAVDMLDAAARAAHRILDEEALGALGSEERALLGFLLRFTTTTGGTYTSNPLDAPAYNWGLTDAYLEDGVVKYARYFEPGSEKTPQGLRVPATLPSVTSAYHLFRSLAGDDFTTEGLSGPDAEQEWEGQHAPFTGRQIDLAAVARAFLTIAPVLETPFLDRLERGFAQAANTSGTVRVPGVDGDVLLYRETPYGDLLIGGPGANRYMDVQASILVDVGGNDTYEVEHDLTRLGRYPLRILIDLHGDDVYGHRTPFGPGAGVFGLGILLDQEGDDIYSQGMDPERGRERETLLTRDAESEARWVHPTRVYGGENPASLDGGFSYGAAYFGIGMHIDRAGDDTYLVDKWALGAAYGPGVGLLSDEAGNDWYIAAIQSIGIGFNKGVGLLRDQGDGKDVYQSWGVYRSHYQQADGPDRGFEGFGIGVGSGWRSEAWTSHTNRVAYVGGFGFVSDGGGDDLYVGSTFGLGNGFSAGIGALIDGAGDDVYIAMKREEEDHSGLGEGIHHGTGLVLDRAGDDLYSGGATSGSGWDLGVGFLIDVTGDDTYTDYMRMGFKPGAALVQSLAVFLDGDGVDTFSEWTRDWADAAYFRPRVHEGVGGNFSFVLLLGEQPDRLPPELAATVRGPVTFTPVSQGAEEDVGEYPRGIGVVFLEARRRGLAGGGRS
jgi:hypothetical protein